MKCREVENTEQAYQVIGEEGKVREREREDYQAI